jgi:O-antigen/teichoic acid export membrane protein
LANESIEMRANWFRRIAANTLLLGASEIIGRIFSFVAIVHLSRVLLPDGMGIVDIGIAIFVLTHNVSRGGVEVLAAQRATRPATEMRRLAGTSLVVSGIYFAVFYVLLVPFLVAAETPRPGILSLFGLAGLIAPLAFRFASWGRERMGILAASNSLSLGVFALLSLALVQRPADLWRVAPIWLAVESARVLPQSIDFVRRHGAPRFRIGARALRVWLARSLPVTLSRVARGLHFSLDILLLGLLAAPAAVGLYGAALRLPRLLTVLAMIFFATTFPALIRALADPKHSQLRAMYGALFRLALGVAFPVIAALAMIADPLMPLLFGEAFREAGPLLQILVWRALLVAIYGLQRNLLLADRPTLDLKLTLAGLATTAVAIVLLVPVLGPTGAAFGALLGQAIQALGYAAATRHHVGVVPSFEPLWVARLAGGLTLVGLASLLTATLPPVWHCTAVLAAGAVSVVGVAAFDVARLWKDPPQALP